MATWLAGGADGVDGAGSVTETGVVVLTWSARSGAVGGVVAGWSGAVGGMVAGWSGWSSARASGTEAKRTAVSASKSWTEGLTPPRGDGPMGMSVDLAGE